MPCSTRINIRIEDLGQIEYKQWRDLLPEIFAKVGEGEFDLYLQFCEHPRVITVGRSGLGMGFKEREDHWPVISVDRGGSITAHFPGQLMIYPVVNLKRFSLGIRSWLKGLIGLVRSVLCEMGVDLEERQFGLWNDKGKVVSFGLGARRYISYHGVGLIYRSDDEVNRLVWPCGEEGRFSSLEEMGLYRDGIREELIYRLSEKFVTYFTSPELSGKINQFRF